MNISEQILDARIDDGHQCDADCFCGVLDEVDARFDHDTGDEDRDETPTREFYPLPDRNWWAELREYGGEA